MSSEQTTQKLVDRIEKALDKGLVIRFATSTYQPFELLSVYTDTQGVLWFDIKRIDNSNEDEEGVANWMIDFEKEERIRCRIACPELGYPSSEARYATIVEWEKDNKKSWLDYIAGIA